MIDPEANLLEAILRHCADARPAPWYPSVHAQATGMTRDQLDPVLDQLRMAGLIRLTDWEPGNGQGYTLTEAGATALDSPRLLTRLRGGQVPAVKASPGERLDQARRSTVWERGEAVRAAFLSPAPPLVTFGLIALNVVWFAAGLGLGVYQNVSLSTLLFGGDLNILHQTGAIKAGDILYYHEWWRLLTCCFVHVGLIHLGVNMYSLYIIGPLLEQLWGSWRFLILYLLAGFGGSCAMLVVDPMFAAHRGPLIGAGASGAIWGILGSMATWLFLNRHVLPPTQVALWRRQLLITLLLNVFITFSIQGISKGAHFGGGLVGLLAAAPMDFLRFGRGQQRLAAAVGLVLIPVACGGILVRSIGAQEPEIRRDETIFQLREFAATVAPRVLSDLRRTDQTLQTEAAGLLDQPVAQRDEKAVQSALQALAGRGQELSEAETRLEQFGSFHDPERTQELQRCCQVVAALRQFLEHIADRLKQNSAWTKADNQEGLKTLLEVHWAESWLTMLVTNFAPN